MSVYLVSLDSSWSCWRVGVMVRRPRIQCVHAAAEIYSVAVSTQTVVVLYSDMLAAGYQWLKACKLEFLNLDGRVIPPSDEPERASLRHFLTLHHWQINFWYDNVRPSCMCQGSRGRDWIDG